MQVLRLSSRQSSSVHFTILELPQPERRIHSDHFMTMKPATSSETEAQRFERVFALAQFKPLKAILDSLRVELGVLRAALTATSSYPELLSKLGYRVVQVKQIHENDCYARLGEKGGIRAVHPYHDTDSYSTLVTLVNFDSTVSTTPNAVVFFNARLTELKAKLLS